MIKSISHGIITNSTFTVPENLTLITFGKPGTNMPIDMIKLIWDTIEYNPETYEININELIRNKKKNSEINFKNGDSYILDIYKGGTTCKDMILDYSTTFRREDKYEIYTGLYYVDVHMLNKWNIHTNSPETHWKESMSEYQILLNALNYEIDGKFICLSEITQSIKNKGILFIFACKEIIPDFCTKYELKLKCCDIVEETKQGN